MEKTLITRPSVQIVEVSDEEGQRLDNFLIARLKGVPKSRIYRLIRKGEVRVNKKRCKPDDRLTPGDQVRIPPVRVADAARMLVPGAELAELLRAAVISENDDFLVLNKPAGLSVHGGSGVPLGLIEALRQLEPRWEKAELAHRLDRDTSGCVVIAKTQVFLKYLHNALKAKQVNKQYLALVQGYWPDALVEVDAPLTKNHLLSGERVVKVEPGGKASLTRFKLLERFGRRASLVQAMPVTGRTHQIRVHCLVAGHPILGDPKYSHSRDSGQPELSNRLCLHSSAISFAWPAAGPVETYSAEPGPVFVKVLNSLRMKPKNR
jgi:23S rRNA pseudouridine955/2504/2580 synthase